MDMTTRRDTHKPSLLDPSEYSFLGVFYQGSSDDLMDAYAYEMTALEDEIRTHNATQFDGNHAAKLTCDHCGATFAHGAVFLHNPTNEYITVGHICANDTIGLPTKAAAARRAAEKKAEAAKIARESLAAAEQWKRENPLIGEFLQSVADNSATYHDAMEQWNAEGCTGPAPKSPETNHPFLHSMVHTVNRYGSLTPRQADAVLKFKRSIEERASKTEQRKADEITPTTPVVEGRREITGTIVATKWSEDRGFGSQPKMLIVEADGNKVWGTVPEHGFLTDEDTGATLQLDALRGMAVTVTAKVERSNDDEHFGFFSRPSKMTTKEVTA
jgi:hypothetical protein